MDEAKVEKMFQKLKKEGYEIHMIGLIISHAESCDRQINRAHETGRWPSKGLAYDKVRHCTDAYYGIYTY